MRRFSSPGLPSATIRPRSSTAMRPASSSASSRYWVVRKIVTPPAASSRILRHMVRRLRGSSPVVGSSRKIKRGVPTRVIARSSRRRMPPEYVDTCLRAASASSNRSSSSATRARPLPRPRWCRSAIRRRFSSPVSRSSTAENWPVTPIAARTPSGSVTTSWPATPTWPESAGISVDRICTIVVLPAPLGPSRAKIVPSATVRSMPSSTTFPPNDLDSPATVMAGTLLMIILVSTRGSRRGAHLQRAARHDGLSTRRAATRSALAGSRRRRPSPAASPAAR